MDAHALAGARLKLVRAEKHFQDITEILKRLEHGECEIIPEEQSDGLGVLRVRLSPKPPDDLPVIVGDCLFNLRSALDHLVWQLVIVNKGTPTDRHFFPICSSSKAFSEAVAKHHRLDDAPAKAVTLIESLQPYYTGETHPLALLSKLHNVDKHRNLNLVTAVASDTELNWGRPTSDDSVDIAVATALWNDELRDGAIMPLGLKLDHPDYPGIRARFHQMKVQGYAAMFVSFADRMLDPGLVAIEDRHDLEPALEHLRVDWVLKEILEFVRDTVLPTFEPFFN